MFVSFTFILYTYYKNKRFKVYFCCVTKNKRKIFNISFFSLGFIINLLAIGVQKEKKAKQFSNFGLIMF